MCDCIAEVNKMLSQRNTMLALDMTFDFKGKCLEVLPVPTKKIDSKKREPAVHIAAQFCPFCGEKMQQLSEKDAQT